MIDLPLPPPYPQNAQCKIRRDLLCHNTGIGDPSGVINLIEEDEHLYNTEGWKSLTKRDQTLKSGPIVTDMKIIYIHLEF